MSGLKEVARFDTAAEARVVVALLTANGVEAVLADAHMHEMLHIGPPFFHYRIMAPADQAAAAKDVLDQIRD
jgi:hypothetical protein